MKLVKFKYRNSLILTSLTIIKINKGDIKMKPKKFIALFLTALLVLSLAGCGGKQAESKKPAADGKKKIKVALVLTGLLGDKSFNDLCYEGVKQAEKDYGIELKVLESKDPADWESNLVSMAAAKYDLVIASSTQLEEAIKKHAPEFPDVKFGIIDGVVEGDNVISAVFAQNQSSFLVGAAAAMATKSDMPNMNKDKTIGFIGGMDIPVINDFRVGFEQGVKYVDPDAKVLVSYAGTFNDPLKGKELALAQFSQGADVIFNAAAGTGNGVLEAANQEGKYAIGCDINQDNLYPGHILISELKYVNKATYMMCQKVVEGKFKGGEVLKLNITNDGVGASDMSEVKKAVGDKFPQEIPDNLKKIEKDMKDGKIKVEHFQGFTD